MAMTIFMRLSLSLPGRAFPTVRLAARVHGHRQLMPIKPRASREKSPQVYDPERVLTADPQQAESGAIAAPKEHTGFA